MKRIIIIFSLFNLFSVHAQTIIGDGLTGQPLLDFVVNNYKTNTTLGYDNARDTLYSLIDLQQGNQLSGVYTGYTITLDTTQDPSTNAYNQGINCEHTWPQSMGAGDEPQKSDMHHLFPCKSNVNSSRGNDPYAEIPDTETDTWYRNDYSQETIPTEYIDEFAEKFNPDDPND
ncbi:MAG: endonuclease, partial [Candidatus Brocadiales bacterium]|nr:endonuclease [Candidatus Brocadiales bacterium]